MVKLLLSKGVANVDSKCLAGFYEDEQCAETEIHTY
jgi:hypothetical protein